MFEVEYKGANCVVISSKKASIITDPKLSLVGLKDANVKDAIELATEARFAVNSDDAKLVLEGPGEYGVADFDIRGIAAQRHLDSEADPKASTMYRIESGDIRAAVIGNIYEKLSEEQLEELGIIDVLIIPVGGSGYTLDATGAATITRQIDPKIVVPVHYADPALNYEVPQSEVDVFLSELGAPVEEASKLKLKNTSALPSVLTVYKLNRG
ncbi:Zn-dependent hydrolase [Candidatus Saccharibacteria bacterium 47-87]|nr:MBL fold metallo-hydrolase [Candidatus Saccharibacteria bacterium]OJU96709.1 MAG: Zn-dependent hydrolase [Candidatus Saccharibacteria bacterium 47-87]